MLDNLAQSDRHETELGIPLWGPVTGNPPHVSLIMGGQFPQVSLRDYFLVSKTQLRGFFEVAYNFGADQSVVFAFVCGAASIPTSSTTVIDTWYGNALARDPVGSGLHWGAGSRDRVRRVPARDEGLFFDPDDFVER